MNRFNFRVAILVTSILTLAACNSATPIQPTQPPAPDHSGHTTAMTSAPYDATFIDSMIVHHQGAIIMAQQALKETQRPELKQMAEAIVKAQQTEIDQMKQWRKNWYPDLKDTGMTMDMGPMEVGKDTAIPFEIRFIDAMIPHHESAISMAKEAQQKAEHAELKAMAETIIKTQSVEIEQMKAWRAAWTKK